MHGLILVTWENFLAERFGASLRNSYRNALEEASEAAPLVSKIYQDEKLLKGIDIASKLTGMSENILLREYGHYFITNRLTNHICVYLLSQVKNGRELLLTMREAHVHMRHTPDGLSLPIFTYEQLPGHANNFALIYGSPRQLCPILYGAIEGAMERFGEKVSIRESICMKRGAAYCRFEVSYLTYYNTTQPPEPPELQQKRQGKLQFANTVMAALRERHGLTLLEIRSILQDMQVPPAQLHLNVILEALLSLQYAGLVTSSANCPRDTLANRRYWRTPTIDPV